MNVVDSEIEEACRASFLDSPDITGGAPKVRLRPVIAILVARGWVASWPGPTRRGLPSVLHKRRVSGTSEVLDSVDIAYLTDHIRQFRRHHVCYACGQLRP